MSSVDRNVMRKIEKLFEEHKAAIDKMKNEHRTKIKQIQNNHKKILVEKREEWEKENRKIKQEQAKEINKLNKKGRDEIDKIKKDNEKLMKEFVDIFQVKFKSGNYNHVFKPYDYRHKQNKDLNNFIKKLNR